MYAAVSYSSFQEVWNVVRDTRGVQQWRLAGIAKCYQTTPNADPKACGSTAAESRSLARLLVEASSERQEPLTHVSALASAWVVWRASGWLTK
jgi:hypothetical protein